MAALDFVAPLFSASSLAISTFSIWVASRSARNAVRPVLTFSHDQTDGWMARNVGSGPALNVLIAQSMGDCWQRPVRAPDIERDGFVCLTWCRHDNISKLGVAYEDVNGNRYTTKCSRDRNRVERGYRLPKWNEDQIGKHWADGQIVPPIGD